jgi:hypothetical protein
VVFLVGSSLRRCRLKVGRAQYGVPDLTRPWEAPRCQRAGGPGSGRDPTIEVGDKELLYPLVRHLFPGIRSGFKHLDPSRQ